MPLDGDFATMPASELLQWISFTEKSGTLVVHNGETILRIAFISGKVAETASTAPQHDLGRKLVKAGVIGENERSKAAEVQESTGTPIGNLLLSIGAISDEELFKLLRDSAIEQLREMLEWQEARFAFVADDLPAIDYAPLRIDPMHMLMDQIRRRDEAMFERELPETD